MQSRLQFERNSTVTTLDEITEQLRERFGEDSGLDATFKFDFGDAGAIFVDAASVPHVISNEGDDADCTISISLDDFREMASGELSPTAAFMMGKLKIDGSMSIAMKLADVL